MSTDITFPTLVSMFRAAIAQVRANVPLLTKLDSVGGDGDHGTTMLRGMEIVEKTLVACPSQQIKDLLEGIGWGLMGVDGGATGPLLGTFFGGMADPTEGKSSLDAPTFAAALEAGLAKLQKMSKAKVGDKTMMDALIPAVAAAQDRPRPPVMSSRSSAPPPRPPLPALNPRPSSPRNLAGPRTSAPRASVPPTPAPPPFP